MELSTHLNDPQVKVYRRVWLLTKTLSMLAGALNHQEESAGIQENPPGQLAGAQDQVHRGPALRDDGPAGLPQLLRLISTSGPVESELETTL